MLAEEVTPGHLLLVRHLIGRTYLHWTFEFASDWIFTRGIHTHHNGCRSLRGRPLISLPLDSFKYYVHGARAEVGLERIRGQYRCVAAAGQGPKLGDCHDWRRGGLRAGHWLVVLLELQFFLRVRCI